MAICTKFIHNKQMGFVLDKWGWFDIWKVISVTHHINMVNEKNTIWSYKFIQKNHLIKFNMFVILKNHINQVIGISSTWWQTSTKTLQITSYFLVKECFTLKIRNKASMSTHITLIQHSLCQSNKSTKENKRYTGGKK